ncbi:two-component system sensor histidine kinase NtrB [Treponema zioleckii]|uniref:two-component system sensor histidine kinase NtrB n=1 Tax=Treponema zioleckii TaxID=331680 RepID=UPI00168BB1CC|nr:ATP-binding protein [Treponema zioleckii]
MQEFSKRVTQKLSKLSNAQIQSLVSDISNKNEMFDSIFQSLATGLMIVDTDFHLIKINKAAERYLQFSKNPEDSDVENLAVWELILEDEVSDFLKKNFQNENTNVSDEFTLTTTGGSTRFIDIFISPLVQKSNLIGSIVRIEDVTEKRNQEILLHRMETLASLTNIAASVAHEIKNPLGAISIHIQLIQKAIRKKRDSDGQLPEPKFLENHLDVVNQEIDRLNKIVVDFLMAVRPISANLELVEPNKLLEEFIAFFMPEFNEKNVIVESKLCKDCPRLLLDKKLFREVIVNLAQNALAAIIKRIEELNNPMNGALRIKTEVKDDKFYLYFCDNGCGMDDQTASRVFEPYFTTKANGTGLGMAMAYKIIKEFSGDISVKSVLGEGTLFTIVLPIPQKDKRLLTVKN